MAASKGNAYWKVRRRHGRLPLFDTPESLWQQCEAYFEWVENHPLLKQSPRKLRGQIFRVEQPLPRPMSLNGLCAHVGISFRTWTNYRQRDDFVHIIARVENVIWEQQFTGAAVGLFNPAIVARSLAQGRPF